MKNFTLFNLTENVLIRNLLQNNSAMRTPTTTSKCDTYGFRNPSWLTMKRVGTWQISREYAFGPVFPELKWI